MFVVGSVSVQPPESPSKRGIEMIFNTIICSTFQSLANRRPSIPVFIMSVEEGPLLLPSPLRVLDERVELVMPPLSTLLACPPRDVVFAVHGLGYIVPFFDLLHLHDLSQGCIFLNKWGTTYLVQAFRSHMLLILIIIRGG